MPTRPLRLTLYTVPGCCLCETLRGQLQELRQEIPLELEEVDITGDPELERQYRTEIPVLLVNGRKTVKYRMETPALRQRLLRASGRSILGFWRLR